MTCLDYTAPEGASTLAKSKTRAKHKLIYSIGLNDSLAPVYVNGKPLKAYKLWGGMLERCYSADCQAKHPTYLGCSVAEDWLSFSAFEMWFNTNYVDGYHLDKDILVQGNKVYSAETCVFVTKKLNTLLTDSGASRGVCPLGVCFRKDLQKYAARVHTDAGLRFLGHFTTALEAHRAYQLAKADVIASAETNDPRIRKALALRVAQLHDDHANNRITTKL